MEFIVTTLIIGIVAIVAIISDAVVSIKTGKRDK